MGFWKRKRLIAIGLPLSACGSLLFGSMVYVDNNILFVIGSIIGRLMQGSGAATTNCCMYA